MYESSLGNIHYSFHKHLLSVWRCLQPWNRWPKATDTQGLPQTGGFPACHQWQISCYCMYPSAAIWSPNILSASSAQRSRSLPIFLSVNRSWGIKCAQLTKAVPIAFRIWPEAQLYFSSLCHSTWKVQFVSFLFLTFKNIQKLKKKTWLSETNQACPLKIIFELCYYAIASKIDSAERIQIYCFKIMCTWIKYILHTNNFKILLLGWG